MKQKKYFLFLREKNGEKFIYCFFPGSLSIVYDANNNLLLDFDSPIVLGEDSVFLSDKRVRKSGYIIEGQIGEYEFGQIHSIRKSNNPADLRNRVLGLFEKAGVKLDEI